MKKLILAIALVFSLCMAEVYKPKLEVGREIEISHIKWHSTQAQEAYKKAIEQIKARIVDEIAGNKK